MTVTLYQGDCLIEMDKIANQSVDAVITDPPYPCIKRAYGYWTVDEWWALIVDGVIPQVRRILKPTGSAVFILQPNSEHVGQMRGWLWEFMAWVCREWNMIQDVWWWNYTMIPYAAATIHGLTRGSVKACVWCGTPTAYRDQLKVLRAPSPRTLEEQRKRCLHLPSGHSIDIQRAVSATKERGGSTPFNMLMIPNNGNNDSNHSGSTPLALADWWTRYIVPPGGVVCDPFIGSGTMGLAALDNNCSIIGIERDERHFQTAQRRLERAMSLPYQMEFADQTREQ